MWIFLTHHLTFCSSEKKDVFLQRLNDHAESSRSLNYFTAPIQDYGIIIKSQPGRILIRNKFGRENFHILLIDSETDDGCIVHVTIRPTTGNIAMKALLALFVLICPFALVLKIGFVGVLFIIEQIALAFKVWWAKDFFEKKLLIKGD